PWPVIKIIGMGLFAANSRWSSSPLCPFKRTSSTRQAGTSSLLYSRNSFADENVSELRPTDFINLLIASRIEGSSSTTKTVGAAAIGFDEGFMYGLRSPPVMGN